MALTNGLSVTFQAKTVNPHDWAKCEKHKNSITWNDLEHHSIFQIFRYFDHLAAQNNAFLIHFIVFRPHFVYSNIQRDRVPLFVMPAVGPLVETGNFVDLNTGSIIVKAVPLPTVLLTRILPE